MIKPNRVYLWEESNTILGFCRVDLNGIKDDFGGGYSIMGLNGEMEKSGLAKNRAIKQVKIQFANVFDAIKLYGKKIIDKEGNVDQKEFMKYEKATQRTRAKQAEIDLEANKDKFTLLRDLDVLIITENKANKLGIGNK